MNKFCSNMLEIMFFFALFDCLYIIESFKKIREIAGFIPNPSRFHGKNWKCKSLTKNLLKPEPERIEACWNTVHCYIAVSPKEPAYSMHIFNNINPFHHINDQFALKNVNLIIKDQFALSNMQKKWLWEDFDEIWK